MSSTTIVNRIVPTATPVGPPISIEITPTIDAATKLTKLLPKRMKAINFSGCLRSFSVNTALLLPFLAKCLMRYLFTLIRAVSVAAKNADSIKSIARSTNSGSSGMSSLNYSDSFIVQLVTF